uniref:SFRICE_019322 n=1 Tax=Spodoptera frugiperda TaxID=7108 RepID=A0A2H1VAY7_SPOFR
MVEATRYPFSSFNTFAESKIAGSPNLIYFLMIKTFLHNILVLVCIVNEYIGTLYIDGQYSGEYNVIENYKNKVILYQGFTYAQRGSSCLNYYCSQKDSKHCRAKLKLTKEGALQWVYDDHSHPKPIVHRSKDGKYYKY